MDCKDMQWGNLTSFYDKGKVTLHKMHLRVTFFLTKYTEIQCHKSKTQAGWIWSTQLRKSDMCICTNVQSGLSYSTLALEISFIQGWKRHSASITDMWQRMNLQVVPALVTAYIRFCKASGQNALIALSQNF